MAELFRTKDIVIEEKDGEQIRFTLLGNSDVFQEILTKGVAIALARSIFNYYDIGIKEKHVNWKQQAEDAMRRSSTYRQAFELLLRVYKPEGRELHDILLEYGEIASVNHLLRDQFSGGIVFYINGKRYFIEKDEARTTYRKIVELAFGGTVDEKSHSIAFSDPSNGSGANRITDLDNEIHIHEGMKFTVGNS